MDEFLVRSVNIPLRLSVLDVLLLLQDKVSALDNIRYLQPWEIMVFIRYTFNRVWHIMIAVTTSTRNTEISCQNAPQKFLCSRDIYETYKYPRPTVAFCHLKPKMIKVTFLFVGLNFGFFFYIFS